MSLPAPSNGADLISTPSPAARGLSVGASAASQSPAGLDSARKPSPPGLSAAATNGNRPPSPKFSAATESILRRLNAEAANPASTAGFEAAKESILKGMKTSDKIPLPPPSLAPKRGRPLGKGGAGSGSRSGSMAGASSTPESATRGRGRGSGRGRGRGRGGGRPSKRKREDSDVESELTKSDEPSEEDPELDDDEGEEEGEDENEYTPLPTRTKSGRSINKPTQFVPPIRSPASAHKKRKPYRRNPESALCKACHRGHSPNNNQIVFCDGCGAAYHQYCHDPPIDRETVLVPEKEWFCVSCVRRRTRELAGTALDGLVSGDDMSDQQKRKYLSTLPQPTLVDLLIHASALYPSLPLFPKSSSTVTTTTTSKPSAGNTAATGGALSTTTTTVASAAPPSALAAPEADDAAAATAPDDDGGDHGDQHYDGYDTDPPAHYPKPGNGLARTLPPEPDDLEFLVDTNADVFSHEFDYPVDDPAVTAVGAAAAEADVTMEGV